MAINLNKILTADYIVLVDKNGKPRNVILPKDQKSRIIFKEIVKYCFNNGREDLKETAQKKLCTELGFYIDDDILTKIEIVNFCDRKKKEKKIINAIANIKNSIKARARDMTQAHQSDILVINGKLAAPFLMRELIIEDPNACAAMAAILSKIRPVEDKTIIALINTLEKSAKSDKAELAKAISATISWIGKPAIPFLIRKLRKIQREEDILLAAYLTLSLQLMNETAVPDLLKLMDYKNINNPPLARAMAASALGCITLKSKEASEKVFSALNESAKNDPDHSVKKEAEKALQNLNIHTI